MENTPGLEISLLEHLALNLTINLAHVLFNVEAVWST